MLLNKAKTAVELFAIKILFGKDWCIMMAMFFAQRVILGKTTFEQVPGALKKGVAEVLIDSGLPELVPEEYGGTAGKQDCPANHSRAWAKRLGAGKQATRNGCGEMR